MVVGDDNAVGADDHPRPQGILHPFAGESFDAAFAEEAAQERVHGQGIGRGLDHRSGIDIDHGGADLLDHRGEA